MSSNQPKLRKILPERLRAIGLNEAWLQEQIMSDPSLLGFGELHVIHKERIQSSGGRIDFIMSDPDNEIRYEIEVMLGAVDESHIIRTIEYWDIERQRYPTIDHRAVIVAEEITSRFFNVIRLLNRAVPIIAIQLSSFRFSDEIVLQFIHVLDTNDFGADPDEDEPTELVDRGYWENKTNRQSLAVVDAIKELVPNAQANARITYNKHHIALGTSGYNFVWFHPRRVASHCHMHIKFGAEKRQEIIDRLEAAGIEAENQGRGSIRLHLNVQDIANNHEILEDVMRIADEWSQR